MFTNPEVLPKHEVYRPKESDLLKCLGTVGTWFEDRFWKREYTRLYVMFWGGVLAFMIAEHTIFKLLWAIVNCCRKSKHVSQNLDYYREVNIETLRDLHDKSKNVELLDPSQDQKGNIIFPKDSDFKNFN